MTVVDQSLAETLLSLADTDGADFDPAELLYTLTTATVRLLEVDAAAVLLIDEHDRLVPVAATNDSTVELENLQVQVRQGPCLECTRTQEAVLSADLDADAHRWPEFVRLARDEGFRSVHAEPLCLRGQVVGGLNLLRARTGLLPTKDQMKAQQLATRPRSACCTVEPSTTSRRSGRSSSTPWAAGSTSSRPRVPSSNATV